MTRTSIHLFLRCPLALKLMNCGVSLCAQIRVRSMEPSQTPVALLFNSGVIPTSMRSQASSSKYSIAISFVQRNALFSETLCCDFSFTSGCAARNLRKKKRDTFLVARACFAFTLSGMYLFQLPTPFFFS